MTLAELLATVRAVELRTTERRAVVWVWSDLAAVIKATDINAAKQATYYLRDALSANLTTVGALVTWMNTAVTVFPVKGSAVLNPLQVESSGTVTGRADADVLGVSYVHPHPSGGKGRRFVKGGGLFVPPPMVLMPLPEQALYEA